MGEEFHREIPEERIFRDEGSNDERPVRSGQAAKYQKKPSQELAIASIVSRVNGVMR